MTVERAKRAAHALMRVDEEASEAWLRDLARYWPPEAWLEYLVATRRISDEILRSRAFSAWLATHGPTGLDTIAKDARMFRDPHARAVLLGHAAAIGPVLNSALLSEALDAASKLLPQDEVRAWAQMATSAGTLAAPVLAELIAAADGRPLAVTIALGELAPLLDPEGAAAVWSSWQKVAPVVPMSDRADLLSALAPRLDLAELGKVLRALPKLCSPRVASDLLWDLAPRCTDAETIAEAFAAALSLRDTTYRVQALASLMGALDAAGQQAAIATIAAVPLESTRLMGLELACPALRLETYVAWRDAVRRTRGERAALLLNTEQMSHPESQPAPTTSADTATVDDDWSLILEKLLAQAEARLSLTSVTDQVPRTVERGLSLFSLLARMRMLDTERDRFDALSGCISRLSPEALEELVLWLPEFFDLDCQVNLLGLIATELPQARRSPVWRAARHLESPAAIRRATGLLLAGDPATDLVPVYGLFSAVIADACQESRSLALARVQAVSEAMRFLNRDEPLLQSVKAISEVGALWP
jgi:hypothetical protein